MQGKTVHKCTQRESNERGTEGRALVFTRAAGGLSGLGKIGRDWQNLSARYCNGPWPV